MSKTKSLAISALLSFILVVIMILSNIYLDKISITGAFVVENAGDYRTALVIFISLIIICLALFLNKKLRR
jgi:hypothetical protein